MKKRPLLSFLSLASSVFVVFVESAQAESKQTLESPQSPITEIKRVSELQPTVTNAASLLTQEPENNTVVKVIQVKINRTTNAIEVVLETENGALLQPVTKSEGNTLIVDIPNAVLVLPDDKAFQANKPAPGITAISVTQSENSSIRVSIIGEAAVPNSRGNYKC